MMVVGAALSPAPFPPQDSDSGTGDAVVAQKSPLFLLGEAEWRTGWGQHVGFLGISFPFLLQLCTCKGSFWETGAASGLILKP